MVSPLLNSTYNIGGILGYCYDSYTASIQLCYNEGNIKTSGYIYDNDVTIYEGGIVGNGGEILDCYNIGNVTNGLICYKYNNSSSLYIGGISGVTDTAYNNSNSYGFISECIYGRNNRTIW